MGNHYGLQCSPWLPHKISSIFNQTLQKIMIMCFYTKITHQYMDVNNRSRDVNTRKPFGLRSDYVQITFRLRSITFDLCKYYGYIT